MVYLKTLIPPKLRGAAFHLIRSCNDARLDSLALLECPRRGELINRDKASLDIFWLRDESLEESDNLPDPDVLAQEIVEDLEAALEQFREIAADLGVKLLRQTNKIKYGQAEGIASVTE